jgi:hypothetical protein
MPNIIKRILICLVFMWLGLIIFNRTYKIPPAPDLRYRTLTGYVLQLPEHADIKVLSGGDVVIFSVMYPSMQPIDDHGGGGSGTPMRLTLNRMPQRESMADYIASGEHPNYKFDGQKGNYRIYSDKDPRTGNVSQFAIFPGAGGALVDFEDPGSWSVMYRLVSTDRVYGYSLEAQVSKKIKDDPSRIDASLTNFLRGLAVASSKPNRDNRDL